MDLIGLRVFLTFCDPDGDRRVYGAPYGAFVGVVHSSYRGPEGVLCYYVILEEFLLLHRDGAQVRGEVVCVSPERGQEPMQLDPIAENIGTSGWSRGEAMLVRSSPLRPDLSREILDKDWQKPATEREFIYIGLVRMSISKTGVPPLLG